MKKTYLGLFAAGLVMSLASCTSDALESSGPESDLTTFTVKLPAEAMQTRTFGDGTQAKELRCAVYDMQNNYITKVDTKFPNNALETTVTLHLVKGNSYKIAFAAKNSNAPYVFNEQTGKLVADYTKATNNSEALDAFCKTVTTGVVKGGQNLTATLKRPTAQINWGTDDLNPTDAAAQAILAKDGITEANLQTKVVVANVPTTYDVFTEDVDANSPVVNAEFAVAAIPAASEAFPYNPTQYRYVAMSYVLVPKAKTTYDCTLTFNNGTKDVASPVVVASCPVERNYQTNIYGSLLTSPFEYTVKITPAFGEPDNNVQIWDGTARMPAQEQFDFTNKTITISNGSELAWLSEIVNSTAPVTIYGQQLITSFCRLQDYTVRLTADIDMGNKPFVAMGQTGSGEFCGTFDGQNHTIYNLNVTSSATAGLFGWTQGVLKNIKIDGATVKGAKFVGVIAGYMELANTGRCTIENCHVTNAIVEATENKCGGIVGYANNGNTTVTGCTVKNSAVKAGRDAGQVIGCAPAANVINCSADNVTVTANGSDDGSNIREAVIGRVI